MRHNTGQLHVERSASEQQDTTCNCFKAYVSRTSVQYHAVCGDEVVSVGFRQQRAIRANRTGEPQVWPRRTDDSYGPMGRCKGLHTSLHPYSMLSNAGMVARCGGCGVYGCISRQTA